MKDIQGEKYKLAGIGLQQKGALVRIFAAFCGIGEDVEAIMAERLKGEQQKDVVETASQATPDLDQPGSARSILAGLKPLPRYATMPTLSVEEITEAVVGRDSLQSSSHERLSLTDKKGVIADLGPEKLAQVLVEMGSTRRRFLEEERYTFLPRIGGPT
jgi:hypothetical protein